MFHHTIIDSNFGPPTLQKTWPTNQFVSLFLWGAPFQSNPLFFLGVFLGRQFCWGGWQNPPWHWRRFRCFFLFFGEGPISFLFPITLFLLAKGGGGLRTREFPWSAICPMEHDKSKGFENSTKKQKRTFVVVVVVDDNDDHESFGDLELWRWF